MAVYIREYKTVKRYAHGFACAQTYMKCRDHRIMLVELQNTTLGDDAGLSSP